MISRTTNQTLTRNAQQNLQANISRLAKLQEQAQTSAAISRPSDNPSGTADALKVRGEIRANTQYKSNIADANSWLATVDAAMSRTTDLLTRIKDLAITASTSTTTPASKAAIATEIEGLKSDLLAQANTSYLGRNIFAGNSDAGAAVTVDTSVDPAVYTFTGAGDGPVTRRLDANTTVRVDASADAVFGDVFTKLDSLVADLRTNGNISGHLSGIDASRDTVLSQQTDVGIRHARVLKAEETNMEQSVSLESRRSGIEDLDTATVIMDLKLQELAYQSSLAVTAKVLQPTLMDFLR
ncbi:flagellar hook-associated protein FlgL [Arthrobacter sp. Helios]|uniref:flagellar hook-associated protein FlgL n=1 Tax=Arthrobacter sp. Helios TaxID=2828862 RepID=UPI00205A78C5|nr:flagellar hook-associated protein FlgL [Arthrobacter sp. Helios]UPO77091.1 flagellar hook-associated protein FlgL [Arthrobacter sp. Helios]